MSDQPTVLGGTCSARFDPVRELFGAKLKSGEDLGASLALNIDGVRLLSPETIARIFEVQSNGIDLVIGTPFAYGVGYGLYPGGRVCAWGGTGDSCVIIDADRRITFAYVMNKMAPGGGTIAAALAQRASEIVKPTSPS
jgi:hypothetical protein